MIHLLIFLGTLAVFGRCKMGVYEPSVPNELMKED